MLVSCIGFPGLQGCAIPVDDNANSADKSNERALGELALKGGAGYGYTLKQLIVSDPGLPPNVDPKKEYNRWVFNPWMTCEASIEERVGRPWSPNPEHYCRKLGDPVIVLNWNWLADEDFLKTMPGGVLTTGDLDAVQSKFDAFVYQSLSPEKKLEYDTLVPNRAEKPNRRPNDEKRKWVDDYNLTALDDYGKGKTSDDDRNENKNEKCPSSFDPLREPLVILTTSEKRSTIPCYVRQQTQYGQIPSTIDLWIKNNDHDVETDKNGRTIIRTTTNFKKHRIDKLLNVDHIIDMQYGGADGISPKNVALMDKTLNGYLGDKLRKSTESFRFPPSGEFAPGVVSSDPLLGKYACYGMKIKRVVVRGSRKTLQEN